MMRVAVKLLLIFVLLLAGVKIWYGRLEERLQVPVAVQESSVVEPEEERTEIARKPDDYSIIVDRNIFQAVITKVEKVEPQPAQELAATKLKLSLMGTIFGTERDSRAIISDDQKKEQDIFQIGDSIQGALIKSIERGRVVLNVNGADEELLLKDREGGGPAYEPSPADFFQEAEAPSESPAELPAEAAAGPGAEDPSFVQQSPQEVPGESVPEAVEPLPETETPAVISPVARPRPVRRPVRMTDSAKEGPRPGADRKRKDKDNISEFED